MSDFDYGAAGIEETLTSPGEIDSVLTAVNDARISGLYSEAGGAVEMAARASGMAGLVAQAARELQGDELSRLISAVMSQKYKVFHYPIYMAVGQGLTRLQIPIPFPGEGQWLLAGFTYWADPSASASVQVNMTVNNWAIPFALLASKTDVSTRQIGIPIGDTPEFSWTTTGGTTGDRVAVIAIFERAS